MAAKKKPNERTQKQLGKKGETKDCPKCGEPISSAVSQCPWCKAWVFDQVLSTSNDLTVLLSEATEQRVTRIASGPWDECFGEDKDETGTVVSRGIVTSSVALVGGAPGAGKSTTALQIADAITEVTKKELLYIAAEEGVAEIKHRALRIGIRNLDKIRVYPMGADTDLAGVIRLRRPCAMVIDSIQGLSNVLEEQVDLCKGLKNLCVELDAPAIVISQVTKGDTFAGLMSLQHAVDTLITLYPTGVEEVRLMTTVKNRFGRANVMKELLMTEHGVVDYVSPLCDACGCLLGEDAEHEEGCPNTPEENEDGNGGKDEE